MNKTLSKIIRYASLAMAIIAGYSMAVSLIVYKFNFAAMPLYENLIILNSLLMLTVGIGELLSVYLLGMIFYHSIKNKKLF